MTLLPSYDVFFLSEATVSIEISNFFIYGRIWLKFGTERQILGADSESEVRFYIRGQCQADIGDFLQFCFEKRDKHCLIIGLLWQQLKSQVNKTYISGCSIHRLIF